MSLSDSGGLAITWWPAASGGCTHVIGVDETADALQRAVEILVAVVLAGAGVPDPVVAALGGEDVGGGALGHGDAEQEPGALAEVEEVVDEQHGVLLLVALHHLQELLQHTAAHQTVTPLRGKIGGWVKSGERG